MNNLQIKGNWNQVKGKLQEKYGELTDDDLTYVQGKENELLGRLKKKTGRQCAYKNLLRYVTFSFSTNPLMRIHRLD